ncbi:MAG: PAS domain-containing protein [Betaproteobacteria bacterium]|nr:PAS domain-containing protein [Betaproteobacteria bacterium]
MPFPPASTFGRLPLPARLLLTFFAYLAVAQVTMVVETEALGISAPFWPPSGLALAALVLGRSILWPAVALATLASALISGFPLWVGLAMGAGNALSALLSVLILRRLADFDTSLARPRDVISLCFVAPAPGAVLSAVVGVGALYYSDHVTVQELGNAWRSWWVGDMVGVEILAPLLLVWLQPRALRPRPGHRWEALLALIGLALASLWLFAADSAAEVAYGGLALLVMVIWIGLRLHLRVVSAAALIPVMLSSLFVAAGRGPFAGHGPDLLLVELQVFVAAVTTTLLALAAASRQRRVAERDRSLMAARLEQVLDSLDDVIWTLDPISRQFTFMSGAMARLFGRPAADFCADPGLWMQQLHPDDRAATLAAFERQFLGEGVEHEFRVIDKEGMVRWMHVQSHAALDGEGRVVRLDGITRDVTRLHQAAERLVASEERLRRALGASEVGVWDWNVGQPSLNFVMAVPDDGNYGLEEHHLGLAEWEASLHGEDRARVLQALLDCRDGRSARFRCEYRMRTRHGHWRWFRGEGQVVRRDGEGKALALSGTFRDVHERKQAELELDKLSLAVEQTPTAVFIADAQGQLDYCNQAYTDLTGYPLEELLGLVPDLLRADGDCWRTLQSGEAWRGEAVEGRRDGSAFVSLQSIAPMRDANGRPAYFVGVGQYLREAQAPLSVGNQGPSAAG